MGAKRIPIAAVKRLAEQYGQTQVIVCTWDKDRNTTHVVTYGKTKEDCRQAAEGGDRIKRALGWEREDA